MKFGDAKVIPFISLEGPTNQAPRAAKEPSIRKRSHVDSDYDAEAKLAVNDITVFVAEGRDIRSEVEGLIVWRRYMGEGTGSQTWGTTQQECSAHWISFQRERLDKLKSVIEAEGRNSVKLVNYIFGDKNRGRYDEQVTKQARQELGI